MDTAKLVIERVRSIAIPILTSLGLELVEVVCVGRGPRTLVQVFIDKPGEVQLADCEEVHHSLGRALDVEDPIPQAYTLEISSPGLDRPFRNREEYQKSIGKRVRVKLKQPSEGQWHLSGRLLETQESGLVVALEERRKVRKAREVRVCWEDIAETRCEVEFSRDSRVAGG